MPSNDSSHSPARDTPQIASIVDDDGTIVEIIRGTPTATSFVVWNGYTASEKMHFELPSGARVTPFAATNNLLTHGVVLLPSEVGSYDSEEELVAEVRSFIHDFVDVSEVFEELSAHYVLFSWVYDAFQEVPYLRVRGDYGSGKSRFLLTVGSLCYKPVFASGASTVSPIFRILDTVRGTLIMDESDFRLSDEKTEIVKILNNGNACGFPVLRSEVTPTKEYNPRAFHVFGPKIIATRGPFSDRALESRCITEELGAAPPRQEIPLNLPIAFQHRATALRNKLLLFRFKTLKEPRDLSAGRPADIEPRVAQIFAPLLATMRSESARESMRTLARKYATDLQSERGMAIEAQLLEAIWHLQRALKPLSVGDIAREFATRFGPDYRRPITARWVGVLLRTRLSVIPQKVHGVFVINNSDTPRLDLLFKRYQVGD